MRMSSPHRRRNRHGRDGRGLLFPPHLPARRTWAQSFEQVVMWHAQDMVDRFPNIAGIEIAVEDVPPSDPTQWDGANASMCRVFSQDRLARLRPRLVLYRLPIHSRAGRATVRQPQAPLHNLVRMLLADGISQLTGVHRDDLYGNERG